MFQIASAEKKLEEALNFFKTELQKIRTGRATPSIVEHILVEVYGSRSPIKQLASIMAPDPRTIIIQPWDKSVLQDVERAIRASGLNLSPAVDGSLVRLVFPPLTEENRQSLVKIVRERAEACRVSMRQQREKIRTEIAREEEEGTLTEDQKFKFQKQLDELIHAYTEKIKNDTATKEQEILTI